MSEFGLWGAIGNIGATEFESTGEGGEGRPSSMVDVYQEPTDSRHLIALANKNTTRLP